MLESSPHKTMIFEDGVSVTKDQDLILEEPLSLRIDGNPYAVVMRTPGDEIYHAAGFFLSEGLVNHKDNFTTLGYCSEEGVNVVTATLEPERKKVVKDLLERRGFISQTSCGICGKELIKDIYQIVQPVTNHLSLSITDVSPCLEKLVKRQSLYKTTRGAHAAMVLDTRLNPLSFAEDVGRHNALDKAIGRVFMDTRLHESGLAVMSSRISYELVQKAARAGLEMIIALSRPTALAVALASRLNMTLACLGKGDAVMVFCGGDRFEK